MTGRDSHLPTAEPILERLHQLMSAATVFGDPIEGEGVTVIPAARIIAGGGGGGGIDEEAEKQGDGGGAGLIARPAGALVIREGRVWWKPAFTVETVATLALLAAIWLARRR